MDSTFPAEMRQNHEHEGRNSPSWVRRGRRQEVVLKLSNVLHGGVVAFRLALRIEACDNRDCL